jgi:putative membrane protein insertion efficiency factor
MAYFTYYFLLFLWTDLLRLTRACSVCHAIVPSTSILTATKPTSSFGIVALARVVDKRPVLMFGALVAHRFLSDRFLTADHQDDTTKDGDGDGSSKDTSTTPPQPIDEPMSKAMIASIGVYKEFISPLLPPACRFLPTCSQYGVQAIKEFGPGKGAILTTWRLLRCTPIGGKGYDPPKWPPVPYWYSSY